jgi:hypothetical protein
MKRLIPLLLLLLMPMNLFAQDTEENDLDETQIHQQLRSLRDRMLEAYQQRKVDALLSDVEQQVVITWQNGERNLSHQEFLDFYDKMIGGDSSVVKEVTSDFEVGGESVLYGTDTAVAYGTCVDHFELSSGSSFDLHSKWTATVVKENETWKVASFHISSDIFDNPLMNTAKSWLVYAAMGGGLIGVVIGLVLGLVFRKGPAASES